MSDTNEQLHRIDDTIAADRALYLAAYWRGHDGEAEFWVGEVDRLISLRQIVEAGPLLGHLTEEA